MACQGSSGSGNSSRSQEPESGEIEHGDSAAGSGINISPSTSSGSGGDPMSSDSIVPDPEPDFNSSVNTDGEDMNVDDGAVDPGVVEVNESVDVDVNANDEQEIQMEDDFVPRLHNIEFPEGVVPFPGLFPVVDVGNFSDESDDGDPNENVQNDVYNDDEQWNQPASVGTNSTDSLSRENDSGEEEEPPADFDPELPARHIYLGEAMEELEGRVVLEEESVMEIPIVVMNFHLIPGQTLPMTVFHAVFQNAIRRCILNERIFGVVNSGHESDLWDGRTVVSRNALGTVAEIYEFQEETDIPPNQNPFNPDPVMGSNFALKAKGRQRFNVLEVRRQADGNLMAKVRIRPEIQLICPMTQVLSNDRVRYQFPMLSSISTSSCPVIVEQEDEAIAMSGAGDACSAEQTAPDHTKALEALGSEIISRRPLRKYYAALTPWPAFVYEYYDDKILVEKIHRKLLNELRGLTQSHTTVPLDPIELSFWLAQNLTMDDSIRLQILQMDSCIQRLQFELSLLQNVSQVISCRRCMTTIGDHADIFAMSSEGPQGAYVNPNGHIHETLTVHEVREIITRGFPSTVASWFQGYSWTIAECRRCRQHLGWKFKATGRLKPKKFWGLARKSITFKYDFSSDVFGDRRGTSDGRSSSSNSFSTTLTAPTLPPSQEF